MTVTELREHLGKAVNQSAQVVISDGGFEYCISDITEEINLTEGIKTVILYIP